MRSAEGGSEVLKRCSGKAMLTDWGSVGEALVIFEQRRCVIGLCLKGSQLKGARIEPSGRPVRGLMQGSREDMMVVWTSRYGWQ